VVAGETGVVLQNRGAGFTLDAAHANVLAPGKRPFHTLTPFMYLRDGKPFLLAGTMGGEGQPQTLVAVTTRVVDHGLDVQSAVEAPRWVYGRTWGRPTRALSIEGRFGDAVAADLAGRGHAVQVLESWSDTAGHAQAVQLEPGGLLVGGGDPRADGPALGC
jgi:gamma-glutamyltranspeptidase/glutathione hydrolase